ncbi:MAG: AMP-binding protein [Treponemataceae bacterium]|nr:AMP-binding protein [Treponemataceae bacterium]
MSTFDGGTMVKTPWYSSYGKVQPHLEYSDRSMVDEVFLQAEKYGDYTAYSFMGSSATYSKLAMQITRCAKALKALGIKAGDKVTVCLPNCPQAVQLFYAINMIGGVASMIHPLSSEQEIAFYLNDSASVAAITIDQFYGKFAAIRGQVSIKNLIIASIRDALNPVMKIGYDLTQGRQIPKIPADAPIVTWKQFLKGGDSYTGAVEEKRTAADPAVMLYSGGTTGVSKGILLSNGNFNALGAQLAEMAQTFKAGQKMLAVMPMFHGFGLGVSIHSMLVNGAECILVPRFTPASYADLIRKKRPNYIAGVPSLYEALLRMNLLDGADLSCLLGIFSGGDSLSIELKKRFDAFLAEHNCKVKVREGFGTTECVTASCLTPIDKEKEGSIGIPLPDTYYKIVKPGTQEELPYGEEGEICLAGPTVMMEYVNHPEETAQTKQHHADGLDWIHTGDLGTMDEEGFIYFKQRLKRMIVTNGYNVYPSQLENILDKHEAVHMSCIIGVKDPVKIQKVKAFVMLKPGIEPSEEIKASIIEHCKKNIAKYAMPYDIEFRAELPKTLVGKVAYRVLEEEEELKK